jgi:hypothetical protein
MVCASALGRALKMSARSTYFIILFIVDSPKETKSPTGDRSVSKTPAVTVSD